MLYTDFMGYNYAAFQKLQIISSHQIHIVHWNNLKSQNGDDRSSVGLHFIERNSLSIAGLLGLVKGLNPALVFVSGWTDKAYLLCAFLARRRGANVVLGLDNHWVGGLKQSVFAFHFRWLRNLIFSHAFVPGRRQVTYAMKLGFGKDNILSGAYTADTSTFKSKSDHGSSRTILFIGRLELVKGIDLLVKAFLELLNECVDLAGWKLLVVGEGTLKSSIPNHPQIVVKGFLDPKNLSALACEVDFFCLPSRNEPWGLVIHEAASCGLPLLVSDCCGANEDFLVPGDNGFDFETGNYNDLKKKLAFMMRLPQSHLKLFGENSSRLAKKNSPEIWSSKLTALISK